MIEHIHGHVRFKLSGATISVNFQPKGGITAVVGENGAGKTFTTVESLRYLLFGSKALRAGLSTYAELELRGDVRIRGQRYTLERSLKAAKILSADGETLAVGQDETTKKVAELLGYGLEVFDLCNAAVQGETQSLGALTAGKRKEKIDEVLRITEVRKVEKELRDEANSQKREAEALTRALPALGEPPAAPAGYRPSLELENEISNARQLRKQHDALTSERITMAPPVKPSRACPTPEDIARLQLKEELEQIVTDGPAAQPPLAHEIDAAERRYAWELERDARGPAPELGLDKSEVEAMLDLWSEIAVIEDMVDAEVTCPACAHEFRTKPELPPEPAHDRATLRKELQRLEAWRDPLPPEPTDAHGSLSPQKAERLRVACNDWASAQSAQARLDAETWPDMTLHEARNLQAQWQAYMQLLETKQLQDQRNAEIDQKIAKLPPVPDLDELMDAREASRLHEALAEQYEQDQEKLSKLQEQIADKLETADDYLEGSKQLAEARAELKSLLAPALSREASALLKDMTAGKLKSLIVDEDMNITVDGLPLETLSGAGKTVANIALRTSLTKVLTGATFPVFLGDEMDGDLDAKRREATTQALVSLKSHLDQIILITHKDVDIADYVVRLGEEQ